MIFKTFFLTWAKQPEDPQSAHVYSPSRSQTDIPLLLMAQRLVRRREAPGSSPTQDHILNHVQVTS